eukprot:403338607
MIDLLEIQQLLKIQEQQEITFDTLDSLLPGQNRTCKTLQEFEKVSQEFSFDMVYSQQYFDNKDFVTPIKQFSRLETIQYQNNIQKTYKFKMCVTNVEFHDSVYSNDMNVIQKELYQVDIIEQYQSSQSSPYDNGIQINLGVSEKRQEIVRTVDTILTAITNTGGFMSILFVVIQILIGSIQEKMFYQSLISKMYLYQQTTENKQNIYQKSVKKGPQNNKSENMLFNDGVKKTKKYLELTKILQQLQKNKITEKIIFSKHQMRIMPYLQSNILRSGEKESKKIDNIISRLKNNDKLHLKLSLQQLLNNSKSQKIDRRLFKYLLPEYLKHNAIDQNLKQSMGNQFQVEGYDNHSLNQSANIIRLQQQTKEFEIFKQKTDQTLNTNTTLQDQWQNDQQNLIDPKLIAMNSKDSNNIQKQQNSNDSIMSDKHLDEDSQKPNW